MTIAAIVLSFFVLTHFIGTIYHLTKSESSAATWAIAFLMLFAYVGSAVAVIVS